MAHLSPRDAYLVSMASQLAFQRMTGPAQDRRYSLSLSRIKNLRAGAVAITGIPAHQEIGLTDRRMIVAQLGIELLETGTGCTGGPALVKYMQEAAGPSTAVETPMVNELASQLALLGTTAMTTRLPGGRGLGFVARNLRAQAQLLSEMTATKVARLRDWLATAAVVANDIVGSYPELADKSLFQVEVMPTGELATLVASDDALAKSSASPPANSEIAADSVDYRRFLASVVPAVADLVLARPADDSELDAISTILAPAAKNRSTIGLIRTAYRDPRLGSEPIRRALANPALAPRAGEAANYESWRARLLS